MTNEELQDLCATLHEQLSDTRAELNKWRAWGDRMPTGVPTETYMDRITRWMQQRPEPERQHAL